MSVFPKVVCVDRDGTCCLNSSDPSSPFYYILSSDYLILKPGVIEAFQILRAHKVPIVLATKQRCISKGLVTRAQVNDINRALEEMLGVQFVHILVEEKAETKEHLFRSIWSIYHEVHPRDIWLFDDSETERKAASCLCRPFDGTDLYAAVTKAFGVS